MSKGYKIRAIIKRPDERYGHVTNISDTLKNLQGIVGGPIEMVTLIPGHSALICNEEGKLRGLQHNFFYRGYPFFDNIVGDCIVVGVDGDELTDLDMSFAAWKQLLKDWGNE